MPNELTTTQGPQLLQMAKISDIKSWYNQFVKLSKDVLKEDLDYGKIPGIEKPALFKPGAEKLRFVYGLQTETIRTDSILDLDQEPAYIDFTYKTIVKSPDGQSILATSEGNANSYETKFAWIWVKEEDLPEGIDKDKLKKRSSSLSEFKFAIDKAETSGQYGKPKEYWDKWKEAIENHTAKLIARKTRNGKEMEAYEMGGTLYRIPNPDVVGLKNTIMKMADKRSFVGAMLKATGASEFFTQDVEDMEIVIDTDIPKTTKTTAETVKPVQQESKKKTVSETKEQPIQTVVEEGEVVQPDDSPMRQAKLKWILQLEENGKIPKAKYASMTYDQLTKVMDDYKKGLGK